MIEGFDKPGLIRRLNFIMSRIYNLFTQNTCETILLINKTGTASIMGMLVKFDTASEKGVILTSANDTECIGALAESGIANGSPVLVWRGGSMKVMLKNATVSAPGNWVKTADTAGRADASNAAPVGGQEFQQIGYTGETNAGGTDQLIEICGHFN